MQIVKLIIDYLLSGITHSEYCYFVSIENCEVVCVLLLDCLSCLLKSSPHPLRPPKSDVDNYILRNNMFRAFIFVALSFSSSMFGFNVIVSVGTDTS